MLFDEPDGVNINRDRGSAHMSKLQKYVREHKLSCGLAFDGDADRCLAVDENGNPVKLDWVQYVKVQTATFTDAGIFGEKSTEISSVYVT